MRFYTLVNFAWANCTVGGVADNWRRSKMTSEGMHFSQSKMFLYYSESTVQKEAGSQLLPPILSKQRYALHLGTLELDTSNEAR